MYSNEAFSDKNEENKKCQIGQYGNEQVSGKILFTH